MKKDLLEKELQKEIKKFRWKRRCLKFHIFLHRQKLNVIQFFAISEAKVIGVKYKIENLISDMRGVEKEAEEEAFYRLYLRNN